MTADIRVALAGLEIGERERGLLERFLIRFLERNAVTNLSSARDPVAVAAHFADSLAIVDLIREPYIDVGSGGGFPGIPLAIATGFATTLLEATAKKARFLSEIVEELGLRANVVTARAEDAARDPELRGVFASATARAVSSAPAVLELTIPFLRVGGVAVLQRGKLDERERTAANDAALVLGAEITLERAGSPFAAEPDERRILLVRKVAETGQRFPRRAGIPAKRPLCYSESTNG
jgi:16S rRNA (guanine527-N7)-methyltransferase